MFCFFPCVRFFVQFEAKFKVTYILRIRKNTPKEIGNRAKITSLSQCKFNGKKSCFAIIKKRACTNVFLVYTYKVSSNLSKLLKEKYLKKNLRHSSCCFSFFLLQGFLFSVSLFRKAREL